MSDVHFYIKPLKKSEPSIATVCQKFNLPQPVKRSMLPRLVTCEACFDWMASNREAVIAQVDVLRQGAA